MTPHERYPYNKEGNPYVLIEPVEVGEYTYFGEWCHISQHTKIGRYCSIGNLVSLGAQPHFLDRFSTQECGLPAPRHTTVGHDVWIGANAVVLAGVTIGIGAVIGAGAVVTRDVAHYAIVAGNPARKIGYRFDWETVNELLASKWWKLSREELQLRAEEFSKLVS